MKTGLYFGSFNPIHIGHLIVANSMLETAMLDEIWFVVSPQNPFKNIAALANEEDRKLMTEAAIKDNPKFKVCDIEFNLPKPSYTIHTLKALKKEFPERLFSIVMGADNLINFHQWKAYQEIIEMVNIQVYARSTNAPIPAEWKTHEMIHIHALPLINVSSTLIRKKVANEESIKYWVPKSVEKYIRKNKLYCEVQL
ncbi:MAG: nicotinate (nicotinamide) nucleotide adenylyltransferase [Chitinophagales bacterium]